ncbi:DUF3081 family protein [Gayadomonas joobiniege]|uniref:DUF3081 family protein n=1 Tax=Gayadomonas joobiniege TaxID=1234606 RepID=UPI000382D556|nr:DUF3081 family protein [Gayadomonas joobiniege]
MENNLDSRKIYQAFDYIRTHGKQDGDQYHYNGLIAESFQDGYSLQITDGKVTLNLSFHQSYDLDYKNSFDLEAFYEKLNRVMGKSPGG